MATRKTKACKAAETLKKPAIWSAEAFGERCCEIVPPVMRATFVALSLLTSNAHAWMDKWAPTFKFAPAKYRKLPERSVGAFVEDSEEYGRPVKYCEGAVLDLNDDGVDDYVFIIPWMGNGLNASGYWVRFIVSDGAKGRKETMVECYGAELSDLVKVGEKTYFRQSNFFSKFEKSEHNHWVYQMFSFDKDGVMKCANDEVGRPFPAATIFYDKPKFKAIELTAADLKQIETETRPTSRKYVP